LSQSTFTSVAGCGIAGECITPGTINPTEVCESCQPQVTPGAWAPRPPTTLCNPGGHVLLRCFLRRGQVPTAQAPR
jgi:hypothetical protein